MVTHPRKSGDQPDDGQRDLPSGGHAELPGRGRQAAEVAPVYVLLASDEASYVSGARIAVTGGKPIL